MPSTSRNPGSVPKLTAITNLLLLTILLLTHWINLDVTSAQEPMPSFPAIPALPGLNDTLMPSFPAIVDDFVPEDPGPEVKSTDKNTTLVQKAPNPPKNSICVSRQESLNFLEPIIKDIAEKIRTQMAKGIPKWGIPALDPLFIVKYRFNVTGQYYHIQGVLRNFSVINLFSFNLTQIETNLPITPDMNVTVHLPYLILDGRYAFQGIMFGIIPIYGQGHFRFKVINVTVNLDMELTIDSDGSVTVKSLNFRLNFTDLKTKFYGISWSTRVRKIIEKIIDAFGLALFRRFKPKLEKIVRDMLQKEINEMLKGVRVIPWLIPNSQMSKMLC